MNSKIHKLVRVIRRMPSKSYLAYIRSPQWKRVREEHLERRDRWCEICRKDKATQVHHWTYAHLGYEYPQDLCAVCLTCHHHIHCSVFEPANDNQIELPFEQQKIVSGYKG